MPQGKRVALVYPGDRAARDGTRTASNHFAQVAAALAELNVAAEPAVYHDEFVEEVRGQLLQVDGVLVWVNPIEGGRDRTVLDGVLREVAAAGVFVSAHPDIILKLGTKEVLYTTRSLGWGCDTQLYDSPEKLRRELPMQLARGQARVLKQYRGNGGNGVWKIELAAEDGAARGSGGLPQPDAPVRVRHAKRGCVEERTTLDAFIEQCLPYFAGSGRMIDQPYLPRLVEGMVRCYLVHEQVAGFGHQAINALYPAPSGASSTDAPQPGPRLYHPPDQPEFQRIKQRLETDWVPAMQRLLGIPTGQLPVLWDADFLLGPKDAAGKDTYVLCEVNVSSVWPFPEWATPVLAQATARRIALAP